MPVTRLAGVDAMRARVKRLASSMPDAVGRALRQEAEVEMTEAKRRTPVDTGALRSSGHVVGPERQGRSMSIEMIFGGSAAPYALKVHEDLDAFHTVGQAKYLESVLNESRPFMVARIAERLDLNKLV